MSAPALLDRKLHIVGSELHFMKRSGISRERRASFEIIVHNVPDDLVAENRNIDISHCSTLLRPLRPTLPSCQSCKKFAIITGSGSPEGVTPAEARQCEELLPYN